MYFDIVAVPEERDLLARRIGRHLLERGAADEIVIELHERAVAQIVRREVVVGDALGIEAAAQRGHGFVARALQPLPIALHRLAGVDGGER
jgi:hypothetical protein